MDPFNAMKNAPTGYLPHIDGLRALAISLVIAFHVFPEFISGGFIGVDVFFVISGYLITGIVLREVGLGTFSLKTFYAHRVRRIFPALSLVLFASLIFGWYVLLDIEFRQLGLHSAAGAGFIANLVFWHEAGYFDTASELKPLLHLWSLGIEEQFYIFWPLLILIFLQTKKFLTLIILIALGSFILNILIVESSTVIAFYSPFTRFWELLVGGILAHIHYQPLTLYKHKIYLHAPSVPAAQKLCWPHELLLSAGLILILSTALILNKETPFPDWIALAPLLGTALVIHSGSHSFIGSRLLSNPISLFIGLISYPLYLWHWPLLSFLKIIDSTKDHVIIKLALILSSILLAWLTYKWVEVPIKRISKMKPIFFNNVVTGLSLIMLFLLLSGLVIHNGRIAPRLNNLYELSAAQTDWSYPGDTDAHIQGNTMETVLFFGDSYIQQYHPRLRHLSELHPQRLKTILFKTSSGCAPIPGINRTSNLNCINKTVDGFFHASSKDVNTVVIGGSWLGMMNRGDYFRHDDQSQQPLDFFNPDNDWIFNNLQLKLRELKDQGKNVYLVLQPPGGTEGVPGKIGNRLTTPSLTVMRQSIETHLKRNTQINHRLTELANTAGIEVINPADWFCNSEECLFSDAMGIPYFKDGSHFRASYVSCCVTAFDKLVILGDRE